MADTAPLRLTIDLRAIRRNWRFLAREAAPAACAAVVKADAYGLGLEPVVQALSQEGCQAFFVALPEEGRRARLSAPDADIYVLHGFLEGAKEVYTQSNLHPVLNSQVQAEAWARQGGGRASAIHVDTGMNRLGFTAAEAAALAGDPERLAALAPALLMSHLACADTPAHPLNEAQLAAFSQVRQALSPLPASLANSAGIALGPAFHFDLVRPGIALYGAPFTEGRAGLEPVVTLEAQILQMREGEPGQSVGYGAAQTLNRRSRIAVLAAGYADGFLRSGGSGDDRRGAEVAVGGRRAPLIGRVSMDLIAVDVSDLPGVAAGDWVELFGPTMPIGEVAAAAGSIPYELLTGLSRRAARNYIGSSTACD